jgi:UPF0755 protein
MYNGKSYKCYKKQGGFVLADENQNKHDQTSSFKEKILRSLHEGNSLDHSVSSEKYDSNKSWQLQKQKDSEHTRNFENVANNEHSDEMGTIPTTSKNGEAKEETTVGTRKKRTQQTQKRTTKRNGNGQKNSDNNKNSRKKEDRLVGRIVLIVVSVLVLMMLIFGFTLYKYIDDGLQPLNKDNKELIQVYIPEGSSNKQIATILEENKVIKSGMVFNYYIKFKNLTDFQSGYYQMSPNMTLDDIGGLLREGGSAEPTKIADGKVPIPEGFDIEKIGDAIEKNTQFKKADFINLMKDETFFNQMKEKYPDLLESAATADGVRYRLEGYLFPATYDYYKDISLAEFVEQMIKKMNSVMEIYKPTIHAKGMSNQQVLALASLVEKEGVKEVDRKKIAQVFYNRLKADMPLQSDISILYALGQHKETVTYADLEVDSPYNLYKNTGYGPGPFDSPSEESINAVLNPIPNDYLYFVADISTGEVYFSKTYEEHQSLSDKYVNNASDD